MRQKSKGIISFILSLILCFSFFPSTVYAKGYNVSKVNMSVDSGNDDGRYITVSDVSVPYWLKSIYDQDEYYYISIGQSVNDAIELSDGDTISVSISINNNAPSRYLSFNYIDFSVLSSYGDSFKSCDTGDGKGSYDASTSTFTYTTTVDNVGDYCWVYLDLIGPTVTSSSAKETFIIGCTDFVINVESEQTGFFNSVKEFFQQLFDKLTSGLDNIGSWFSELGNNIKSWFSELGDKLSDFFSDLVSNIKEQFTNMINNLKTFFSDVGQWFSEIGDRIGSFFTELWENITIKVEGITESISEWWQSIVDFFRSLFVPEDGFFDKYKEDWETWARLHFALLYDVKDVLDGFFDAFNVGGTPDDYITIPEIKLPFLNNKTIVPETRFDLTDFIHSSEVIYSMYQIFQILVTCIGFFLIVKYCMATFSKIITGDDDTL